MNIQEFFQQCGGKWVSQRTTHQLDAQQNQSGRSDLWVDILEPSATEVVGLCQQFNLDPAHACCGLQIRWSEVAEAYQSRFKPRNEGTALLVTVADTQHAHTGQVLRTLNGTTAKGTFSLGTDEVLTILLNSEEGVVTEERLWFASPNLRLRSSLITQKGVVWMTAFCSEIRMGNPTANAATDTTAETTAQSNTP